MRVPLGRQAGEHAPPAAWAVIALLLLLPRASWAEEHLRRETPLVVAAVQLEVGPEIVASYDAYRDEVRRLTRQAVDGGAALLVFPEYAGALLALLPFAWALDGAARAEEALERIRQREPWIRSVRDVFIAGSGVAERAMRDIYGEIAGALGVTIVAGTYFAADPRARVLTNRAVVFGPDGELLYQQDKVLLTEFEEGLGLAPGEMDGARAFEVAGRRVALTICRDTFLEEWEWQHRAADLWIDLRANGEPFGPEVAERFEHALPARLLGSGVRHGITVCLTGKLLEFLWEGPSSHLRRGETGLESVASAATWDRGEVMVLRVP